MAEQCIVCKSELTSESGTLDAKRCECPKCGPYSLTNKGRAFIKAEIEGVANGRAKLSHALCVLTKSQPWAKIDSERAKDLLLNTELPRPGEMLDNLILWLGDAQPNLGKWFEIEANATAAIGAVEEDDIAFLLEHCKEAGLLHGSVERYGSGAFSITPIQLTLAGWSRYEELKRGASEGRTAFMAMQFGNAELDALYSTHLRDAVAATGFDLRRVDEHQSAGLIDDHLRVKIRQSRFMIAELTHQNRGAYWEAGFAEGLGKPVIYMCRKDVFEDRTSGTHFDTNHHLTVVWEPNAIPELLRRLKDTIRATMPAEAVLEEKLMG
jgi:hypothetical protein